MRVLLSVLSCLALVMLIAVVAVCGVIGLAEAPLEAGVFLDAMPEYAECPVSGATAVDVDHLAACKCDAHRLGRLVDLDRQVEVLTRLTTTIYFAPGASERPKRPSKKASASVNYTGDNRDTNLGVWRGGSHSARG